MATEDGRQSPSVIERLQREPHRFRFFQAVRVLQRMGEMHSGLKPLGLDYPPAQEALRLRATPELRFANAEVRSLENGAGPPKMDVAFFGLTGPAGVLPASYSAFLIQRLRARDATMRHFFDLFNHRSISLFYRAWRKYDLASAYESSLRHPEADELFTRCLYSLVGFAAKTLRGRSTIEDEAFIYFGGAFAQRRPIASQLEGVLSDYFGQPVAVLQFQGQWLELEPADRTRLPGRSAKTANAQLGVSTVLGDRVWSVQSKFRLVIGPLDYPSFQKFTPGGEALVRLHRLVRAYVGLEFDFDIQPLLAADQRPPCRISSGDDGAALGWNCWLSAQPPDPLSDQPALDDAVFDVSRVLDEA